MVEAQESSDAEAEVGNAERRYRVQSVERALDTLEALVPAGREGLPLVTIARELQISKSTALALLKTLTGRGFVAEVGTGRFRRYRLGLTLARLGDEVLSQVSLLDVALPALRVMTDETGWTSRIGVLDDPFAVIVGRVDGPGIVRFKSTLAQRELPHCSAIGKALLANIAQDRLLAIVDQTGLPSRTAATITELGPLLRELTLVRARQYAVDDEEDNEGVLCVGAAVYDHRGTCVAAVSLTGLKSALPVGGIADLGQIVHRYASQISISLGADSPRASY